MTFRIILAGFGGQGILFAGKQLSDVRTGAGTRGCRLTARDERRLANCSVLSDKEWFADYQPARHTDSLASSLKFEPAVAEGGLIIANSSLIPEEASAVI